jgi:toxin ParE1/3/4
MKYSLKITPKALIDIQTGVDYYNNQQKGLGKKFSSVIGTTLNDIRKMPMAASIAYDDIRFKVVDKFPYVVLYVVRGNSIFVTRVFNTHQQSVY